tara:strand:+ start:439 stop:666 length:228 start_codon:yes stop_codon:yes gene_type:complete
MSVHGDLDILMMVDDTDINLENGMVDKQHNIGVDILVDIVNIMKDIIIPIIHLGAHIEESQEIWVVHQPHQEEDT